MKPNLLALLRLTLVASIFVISAGCTTAAATAENSVSARVELFDRVSTALTTTSVLAVVGTYGSACTSRTGSWIIALNGYVIPTTETALTVVSADTKCVLSVTEVRAGVLATPTVYKLEKPFVLGVAYAALGVPFMLAAAGPIQFYANFRLQPDLNYNSDMVLQMVYSDNVSETDIATIANYLVVMTTATASVVPAPNATLAMTGLNIKVDSHNIVKTATGNIVLTQGTVIAETYVIDLDTVGSPPTYATLDAAYTPTSSTKVAMTGATQNIAAADLNLVGLDLTTGKKRNLIVANTENGVRSYQVFQVTFNHP